MKPKMIIGYHDIEHLSEETKCYLLDHKVRILGYKLKIAMRHARYVNNYRIKRQWFSEYLKEKYKEKPLLKTD